MVKPSNIAKSIYKFTLSGFNLPLNSNILLWGKIIHKSDLFSIIADNKTNEMYYVSLFNNKQEIKIMLNKKVILEFTDYFGDNELSFRRVIKDR